MLLFLHLLFAVIFIGYVFTDALIIARASWANALRRAYLWRSACICTLAFGGLITTGALIALEGFSTFSALAKALFIGKLALLALMIFSTAASIYVLKRLKRPEHFLVRCAHNIALAMSFLIALCGFLINQC